MTDRSASDSEKRTKFRKRFGKLLNLRANRWKKFHSTKTQFRTRRSVNLAEGEFCCDRLHLEPASLPAAACARLSKRLGFATCSRNLSARVITRMSGRRRSLR